MSPDVAPLLISALIALAGGFFRGFAGFGGGLLMAPLLTLVNPPSVVVPVLVGLGLLGDSRLLPEVWKETNFRRVGWLAVPSLIGLPIGITALTVLDPETVRRIVNGIVLALILALARGIRFPGADRARVLVPAGFASGMLTGIGGVGGPPVVVTFLSIDEPAAQTRANLIAFFTISEVAALVMMFGAGVFEIESGKLAAACAVPYYVAIYLGSRRFRKAKNESYRRVALIFLACVALVGLLWPR